MTTTLREQVAEQGITLFPVATVPGVVEDWVREQDGIDEPDVIPVTYAIYSGRWQDWADDMYDQADYIDAIMDAVIAVEGEYPEEADGSMTLGDIEDIDWGHVPEIERAWPTEKRPLLERVRDEYVRDMMSDILTGLDIDGNDYGDYWERFVREWEESLTINPDGEINPYGMDRSSWLA